MAAINKQSFIKFKYYIMFTCLTSGCIGLGAINFIYKKFHENGNGSYNHFNLSLMKSDDPILLKYLNNNIINPPAKNTEPYNLNLKNTNYTARVYNQYRSNSMTWTFVDKVIQMLYKDMSTPGFFIEVGASDGEYLSKTLRLELELGWTGLLIEPLKWMADKLRNKKRKAYFSQSCVSHNDISYTGSIETVQTPNELELESLKVAELSDSKIIEINDNSSFPYDGSQLYHTAQCLPLASYIWAMGRSEIDLIVININGREKEIFYNFPHDKIKVTTWAIRVINSHKNFPPETLDFSFMERVYKEGYRIFAIGSPSMDYVLVSNGSPLLKKALESERRASEWVSLISDIEAFYGVKKYHNS